MGGGGQLGAVASQMSPGNLTTGQTSDLYPAMSNIIPPFAFALILCGTASLCSPAQAQNATDTFFDTDKDVDFGNARPALQEYLVRRAPLTSGRQHFCVVGYKTADGDKTASVHWREGRQIIKWLGSGEPAYAHESLVRSRSVVDLATGVVPAEVDIAGSTYLVTKAWADKVIADCGKHGKKYRVLRPTSKR
jgi:hypothetical protein